MGGLDDSSNTAVSHNSLFVPGQTCSMQLAPTPNVTILPCLACINQQIYMFYNKDTNVWGWIYNPATNTWSDRVTVSVWNHYQEMCAPLNNLVYFPDNKHSEVYNPANNTWSSFPNPTYIQVVTLLKFVCFVLVYLGK